MSTDIEYSETLVQLVATEPAPVTPKLLTIEPERGWQPINARELWRFRELIYFLIWRDVKVRYKQTILGAAWAVLQPAMLMVVFTIFLGKVAKVPAGDGPYPLFVYLGVLPWSFFATAISEVPSTTHPLGFRGGGEGGITPALGVIVNAIVDALADLGVTHLEMPVTPERVWRAIRQQV